MNKPELFDDSNRSTYCPEDDKLRLYVGRVPRDEYLALKAEGWVSTPKQDCDFVAIWTPDRYETCLSYAGIVEDEDMEPGERSADRAERFIGYRERREDDAGGLADRYDNGGAVHGFQSTQRAERAAARVDRLGDRAVDAWGKAEYWQRRTAGVIRHALHKSSPGVRMGRIKTLEAELRKREKSRADYCERFAQWVELAGMTNPVEQTKAVLHFVGHTPFADGHGYAYKHPRPENVTNSHIREHGTSIYSLMTHEADPITGAEACAIYMEGRGVPSESDEWMEHLRLRIAYENQMLEEQGGRAAHVEMVKGGKLQGHLIWKVNKSTATARVTSVSVIGPKVERWTYKTTNIPGTEYAEYQFDTERMAPDAYQPPDEESLAKLAQIEGEMKKARDERKAKVPPCPLINPTMEDAQRLVNIWNERGAAQHAEAVRLRKTSGEFKPCAVKQTIQKTYSEASKGSHAKCETRGLCRDANLKDRFTGMYSGDREKRAKEIGSAVCEIRILISSEWFTPAHVIVITDKPQKPLPAAVWEALAQEPATLEAVAA